MRPKSEEVKSKRKRGAAVAIDYDDGHVVARESLQDRIV